VSSTDKIHTARKSLQVTSINSTFTMQTIVPQQ